VKAIVITAARKVLADIQQRSTEAIKALDQHDFLVVLGALAGLEEQIRFVTITSDLNGESLLRDCAFSMRQGSPTNDFRTRRDGCRDICRARQSLMKEAFRGQLVSRDQTMSPLRYGLNN
jgi:hypothetical protein